MDVARSMLRAGVARVTITPPVDAMLTGFPSPDRRATSVRDDLYATALVLDDGQGRVALLSCDLQCLHPDVVREVRAGAEAAVGIAPEGIMICCSHTHSGPAVYAHPDARSVDRAYVANLGYALVGAIIAAAGRLEPVEMRWGMSSASVGINRREVCPDGRVVLGHNPDGPVDHAVRVLRFDRGDGTPLAMLVNYACHPVVLGGESRAISADYVGNMRRAVEGAVGGQVLFVQGACGDINPRLGPGPDEGAAEALGIELAGAVLTASMTATPLVETSISCATTRLELPLMGDTSIIPDLPSEPELRVLGQGLDQWEPWAADLTTDEASGRPTTPIELQVLRVGALAIVGIPVEPFVEIGLALQQSRPDHPTIVAGYANGCVGYVPMPDAYPLGGYEVSLSFVYPRLPGPLAPECAGRIIEAGTVLLNGQAPS